MLHRVNEIRVFTVGATDGDIGDVKEAYFDDERWAIRYLVVETGKWLRGRKVLISPIAVRGVSWDEGVINVSLSQQQVRESPGIDTDKPVSRQHEIIFHDYYGYPTYWEGDNLWGLGTHPMPWVGASPDVAFSSNDEADDASAGSKQQESDRERLRGDSHLRSSREVIGYEVMATDGPNGSVEDFVFDDETWAIRFLIVDTRKWSRGRHVLIPPEWIDSVNWLEHEVYVKVARAAVETSPEFDPALPLPR